jgi:hypothetical protein
MTQLIKGMIIGAAVTAAALGGYAFGTNQDQSDLPDFVDVADLERGNCDVRVGFGRMTPGDECRFNQVVVGSRSGYLLCADIQVSCQQQ